LDETQTKEFEIQWKASNYVREKLSEVLTIELEAAILSEDEGNFLDSPNALAKVADQRAYRRGLRAALRLFNREPT
jgi:hypothetical protein